MNIQEFITELKESLEFEEEISIQTNLKDLGEWDSLSAMVLIAFVSDKFDKNLTTDDIKNLTTVDSLINLIGHKNFK